MNTSVAGMALVSKETAEGTEQIAVATEEQLASMVEITFSSISLAKMAEGLQDIICGTLCDIFTGDTIPYARAKYDTFLSSMG